MDPRREGSDSEPSFGIEALAESPGVSRKAIPVSNGEPLGDAWDTNTYKLLSGYPKNHTTYKNIYYNLKLSYLPEYIS
jgi:hypothetical protein